MTGTASWSWLSGAGVRSDESGKTHEERIPALDALRGLAAMAVVLYHYTYRYEHLIGPHMPAVPSFGVGHFGVELFFIISGYVIIGSLERAPTFKHFAFYRFARLYPAFVAGCVLTLSVIALGDFNETGVTASSALLGLTMLSPFFHSPTIDPAHWTLAHEISFYGIIGSLFFALGRQYVEAICAAWLLLIPSLLLLAPKLSSAVIILLNLPFANLFVIGVILARSASAGPTPKRAVILVFALAMTALGPTKDPSGIGTGHYMLLIMAFAVSVGAAAMGRLGFIELNPLLFLGRISYPLYLVHETLGLWVIRDMEHRGIRSDVAIVSAVAISVVIAMAIQWLVEKPMQRLSRQITDQAHPIRAIALAAVRSGCECRSIGFPIRTGRDIERSASGESQGRT